MGTKIRIVEFKVATDDSGELFFIEIGETVWEKVWWIIYWPRIIWTEDAEEINKNLVPIGHKTFPDAVKRVNEIKEMQPIYHQIK